MIICKAPKKKWQQKPARSFRYVKLDARPTAEDIASTGTELAELKPGFEAATGSQDSVFVITNASTKNGTAAPYTSGSADVLNDSLITNAAVGTVVGPYKEGDMWKLVKVKELADYRSEFFGRLKQILGDREMFKGILAKLDINK